MTDSRIDGQIAHFVQGEIRHVRVLTDCSTLATQCQSSAIRMMMGMGTPNK
ncbi:hypothetical protein SAMN05421548_11716 [Paraburkholderia lycopersici]|uniref:Uncharacterized protein n=1 Tax=Paraburkholderia lycopersici TaxID=416944 RepID=A0A1G6TES2_9BURK|nr:hypothetical protein SAMN05421548_11716 [Paraburkholderia lycopersici]